MVRTHIYRYDGEHPTCKPDFAKDESTTFDPRIVLSAAVRLLDKAALAAKQGPDSEYAEFEVTGKLTVHNDSELGDVYFKDEAGTEFGTDISAEGFTDEQVAAVNRTIASSQEQREKRKAA